MCRKFKLLILSRFYSLTRDVKQVNQFLDKNNLLNNHNYVNGKRISGLSDEFINLNPATGKKLVSVTSSSKIQIDMCVESGILAKKLWQRVSSQEKSKIMHNAASLIRSKSKILATIDVLDTGKPFWEAEADISGCADTIDLFASFIHSNHGSFVSLADNNFYYTTKEPLGVCVGIGAWNFPFQMISWKSAPAIAAGNSLIFKPSPLTPLSAIILAEIYAEAGVPKGLISIVQGGSDVGNYLTTHPNISKISFTGSVATGRHIMKSSVETLKHLTLELGGKSPLIIFEDANINESLKGIILANFLTQGEVCSNGTRVFIHSSIYPKVTKFLVEAVKNLKIGDPFDPLNAIGAIISKDQFQIIMNYIDSAKNEGAEILYGGNQKIFTKESCLSEGYYIEPCIVGNCSDDMKIVQEEVFGPVLILLKFDSEDEVIARANNREIIFMSDSKSVRNFFSKIFKKPEHSSIKLHYKANVDPEIEEDDSVLGNNNIQSKSYLKRQNTCSFDLSDKTLRLRNTEELTNIDSSCNIQRRSSYNLDKDFPKKLLPISDFVELEVLGEGAFGRAVKVKHIKSGYYYVLKEVLAHTKENEESLIREVSLLRSLKHNNVLATVGLVLKDKRICLLTELMHGGSLQEKINNFDEKININQKLLYLRDISAGMTFLHQHSIMHRDLTSSNCLLRKDNSVVVSDFGLSKLLNDDFEGIKFRQLNSPEVFRSSSTENINTTYANHLEVHSTPRLRNFLSVGDISGLKPKEGSPDNLSIGKQTSEKRKNMNIRRKHTVVGSPFWMAPEMLAGNDYNCLVDLYSFGVIGCEVTARISANPDYLERKHKDMSVDFDAFVKKNKYKELKDCPEELLDLIKICCNPNPDNRSTFNTVLSWLEDILFRVTNNVSPKARWSMALDSD